MTKVVSHPTCSGTRDSPHQGFDLVQDSGKALVGMAQHILDPSCSPADEVGSEQGELLLKLHTKGGAHQMAFQGEYPFLFFDARLDGLITNDKFCFTRWGTLRLSWSRRPLRLRSAEPRQCDTLLEGNTHPGGTDEAGVDNSQADSGADRRSASLGPGLPVSSGMGTSGGARDLVSRDPAGGTP